MNLDDQAVSVGPHLVPGKVNIQTLQPSLLWSFLCYVMTVSQTINLRSLDGSRPEFYYKLRPANKTDHSIVPCM